MIAIIDYGAGNTKSLQFALDRLGLKSLLTSNADQIINADKVIFPGQGAAKGAMDKLKQHELDKIIPDLKQPVLGICLGMQTAVIESARNMAGISNAGSEEFDHEAGKRRFEPIIYHLKEWVQGNHKVSRNVEDDKGGTMRLGAYSAVLAEGSNVAKVYNSTDIEERHRHRYEVDINYRKELEKNGLIFSGMSPDGRLPEIVELSDHPWFIGVQFHPELKSKPFDPHPLFRDFIKAAKNISRLV